MICIVELRLYCMETEAVPVNTIAIVALLHQKTIAYGASHQPSVFRL